MLLIILLSIVQGLTEFLPVSSSGHLVILQALFEEEGSVALEVMLHIGTLLSLFVYFRNDILTIIKDVAGGNIALARNVILGSLPVAVGGFLLSSYADISDTRQVWVVITMLALIAAVMLWLEKNHDDAKGSNDSSTLPPLKAITIGFFQLVALIPGTSRSGITMIGGVANGLTKTEALRFSFLLGMPAIAGAGLATSLDLASGDVELDLSSTELIGAIALSGVVGYLAIDISMKLVRHYGFKPFIYYRFALSLLLLCLVIGNVL